MTEDPARPSMGRGRATERRPHQAAAIAVAALAGVFAVIGLYLLVSPGRGAMRSPEEAALVYFYAIVCGLLALSSSYVFVSVWTGSQPGRIAMWVVNGCLLIPVLTFAATLLAALSSARWTLLWDPAGLLLAAACLYVLAVFNVRQEMT